jgi:hypothetical protein
LRWSAVAAAAATAVSTRHQHLLMLTAPEEHSGSCCNLRILDFMEIRHQLSVATVSQAAQPANQLRISAAAAAAAAAVLLACCSHLKAYYYLDGYSVASCAARERRSLG